ncbi:DEAD/DEAH box helicase family protein [Candidatus Avelusimicrobium faecicola]|uniref:DEAD/DEAH box helicase family protein n=1 Tax=Candidatus Avelusimicrobium faecicola TaxID=3416205 RepID=UPI003D0C99A5
MPSAINIKTKDLPLQFAKQLSATVNHEWETGTFLNKVSPITKDLLKFWFKEPFTTDRAVNFHSGQKQAILNAIYCHEVLKGTCPLDLYQQISQGLLSADMLVALNDEKNKHPKYCIKMATGTGKTWVLDALLVWQYLNAKNSTPNNPVVYTKNFLLVAPGCIVYDRLLDTLLGKEQKDGSRNFSTADLKKHEKLFIPEKYRQTVFAFIQNNVVPKEEIGHKITGEGIIAVTNWHQVKEDKEEKNLSDTPLSDVSACVKAFLPVQPGEDTGHSLESFDNKYLKEDKLAYLATLPNLCVFNDEAHHIHTNKVAGIETDVEWQKALNKLSENVKDFVQIDFSATPYNPTGSGQRRTKQYFPHIIVDFDLTTAIKEGLVKVIAIDKRDEIASLQNEHIEFKAKRDNKKALALSEGQRLMLRAGLKRLGILEDSFTGIDPTKHPKMLVMCEDTSVSPLVEDFLRQEGLAEQEIVRIDSNAKGEVKEKEWKIIKQRLFNIDKLVSPKVIVSVLMLREGFDVSNICVIVPLRSSDAPILLEQTIGRGLRLMWREPEYSDIKHENLQNLFCKKQPSNYLDILSIVEHPAFLKFYEDLQDGLVVEERASIDKGSILGDMITVGLKEDYQKYDLFFPQIVQEREELIKPEIITAKWEPFKFFTLKQLKEFVGNAKGEKFFAEEIIVKTRFGEYHVSTDLFSASNYNDFLVKLLDGITSNLRRIGSSSRKQFPVLCVNKVSLIKMLDKYIRRELFGEEFNPLTDNNWRVLMLAEKGITAHIMRQISQVIYDMQHNITVNEAIVNKRWFSEIPTLKMRENYSLDIKKSIYQKTKYPSNKGLFEKSFLEFADRDSAVERLVKIDENYHTFATLHYIRTDGLLSNYYPDFMVKFAQDIFLVETKAEDSLDNANVRQKQKSALDWCKQISALPEPERMNCIWHYALLDDATFTSLSQNNASLMEILRYSELTQNKVKEGLFE